MKYKILIVFICLLSLFINLYQKNQSPPGFSTDEAAFGYNAYSILKTGRDEHGSFLPLRLQSFNDYKMPLYTYLSIPFIAIGGLSETSTRALNTVLAFFFPLIIILLAQELFKNRIISLVSGFIFSLTVGLQIIGRQAHEAYLTTFLIALCFYFLIRIFNHQKKIKNYLLYFLFLTVLSFGYQFSRLWLGLFLLMSVVGLIIKKINWKILLVNFLLIGFLLIPDLIYKPTRITNLLFFTNKGLHAKTNELRGEGGTKLIYNKLTVGLRSWLFGYMSYFSPQFLVTTGEENKKFGYTDLSYITVIEYLLLFVGIYYLFKNKDKFRYLILAGLFFSPLAASLSWTGASLPRSLPIFIFIILICSYGFYYLFITNKLVALIFLMIYFLFIFYSWDFYFNHYPKRALTIRGWQCGNREMANYVKKNYQGTDKFYITRKNGQPYIFLLFYLKYPPEQYQKQANLSPPDEFGFGQVEKFDKFNFHFYYNPDLKKTVSIGYPDDFNFTNINKDEIKKIIIGNEEMFWIYKIN